MAYRKHWLVNSLGEKYFFTEKTFNHFLNEPTGFGFNRSYNSFIIGASENVSSEQIQFLDISGDLVFYDTENGSKYEQYQSFIQFTKFVPLEFHYQTPNNLDSYHCDIIFTQATKSEISTDGVLHIGVTFHRLSQWLSDDDYKIVLKNDVNGKGKYHDLLYDYYYLGSSLDNSEIVNTGTDEVGFTILIEGETQNPSFTLSQNGTYGVCKLNGTYDYVFINSVDSEEEIILKRGDNIITNPEQYQDFSIGDGSSYLTWCKLLPGTSNFSFNCGNIDTFDGTITISFKRSYISV